ncbi:MAG: alcohol dehydrogenase catalytic domain-containing protein [Bacteroidales bacterium]|nr:alcohol dehydrogenase catalytic domain-containing protein [Bacteroidales bacterium]
MKALVFHQNLSLSFDEPKPIPNEGEALIKVIVAGICNTDIEIVKGYKNFHGILGHEFVGYVESVGGEIDKKWIGKRVVGDINCACGKADCPYCSKNLGRHCSHRTTLGIFQRNGCFAEYITLPINNLLEVPKNISNEMAVLTEPLAAAFEILDQVSFSPKTEVLIVGDGKLGLLINHAVSTTKAKITQVGKHQEKLQLINDNCLETCLLQDFSTDKKFDVVIEATGSVEGFQESLKHTRPRGILVLKSTLADKSYIDLNSVVVNEITIIGSRCGRFSPALRYLETGIDLSPLISGIYPIERGIEAFEAAQQKGNLKILIQI